MIHETHKSQTKFQIIAKRECDFVNECGRVSELRYEDTVESAGSQSVYDEDAGTSARFCDVTGREIDDANRCAVDSGTVFIANNAVNCCSRNTLRKSGARISKVEASSKHECAETEVRSHSDAPALHL